ncbi:hypothetical protein CONCODRAFT_5999, partial [Conidiobolus coronatus NRRL 28638]
AIVNNMLADFPYLTGGGHGEAHITQPIPLDGQLAYYAALRGIFYFLLGCSSFACIASAFLKYRPLSGISTAPGH